MRLAMAIGKNPLIGTENPALPHPRPITAIRAWILSKLAPFSESARERLLAAFFVDDTKTLEVVAPYACCVGRDILLAVPRLAQMANSDDYKSPKRHLALLILGRIAGICTESSAVVSAALMNRASPIAQASPPLYAPLENFDAFAPPHRQFIDAWKRSRKRSYFLLRDFFLIWLSGFRFAQKRLLASAAHEDQIISLVAIFLISLRGRRSQWALDTLLQAMRASQGLAQIYLLKTISKLHDEASKISTLFAEIFEQETAKSDKDVDFVLLEHLYGSLETKPLRSDALTGALIRQLGNNLYRPRAEALVSKACEGNAHQSAAACEYAICHMNDLIQRKNSAPFAFELKPFATLLKITFANIQGDSSLDERARTIQAEVALLLLLVQEPEIQKLLHAVQQMSPPKLE